MLRWLSVLLLSAAVAVTAQTTTPGQIAPPRDTSAAPGATQKAATGKISGRVVAADTGRAISRARVSLSSPQGGGRVVLTDNTGAFELTGLPEGRFTLQVSKSGFIALQYGQRRPQQPGTPIQLAAGQELKAIDFRLPRGGAIAGRVFDENGDPMPGIQVRVLEYRYAQGGRQLVPAGNAQTDDRGEYRVWGLNPGDYYVSATPPLQGGGVPNGRGGGPGAGPAGGRGGPPPAAGADDAPSLGYAPTYYPGTISVSDARAVTLALSAEAGDISFGVSLVRTARITGRLANADGTPAMGMLTLATDAPGRNGGPSGATFGGRAGADGQFTISNVPPGRYTLRARSGANRTPMFASMSLSVQGDDVANVTIVLAAAASISGSATFQNTQSAAVPQANQFRVTAPPSDFNGSGNGQTQIDAKTGTFTMDGLAPGEHLIAAQSPRGWTLKSAMVDGRESIDLPFELRAGQKLTNVSLVFTDKVTEIDGTVLDSKGAPVTEYTVVAFPDDQSLWRAQSRHIMTAKPDQNGKFQIRGLPEGQYYLALTNPSESGEWFEPSFLEQQKSGAKHFSLADGAVITEDFTLPR